MILYFSGTGNSAYVAKRIGQHMQDEVVDLFDKIRARDFSPLQAARPWVVVAPTYAWRIPRIVQEFLQQTPLSGCKDLYFVLTCGGSMGNAGKYAKALCDDKQMTYRGCFPIVMPENYIALFETPTREAALQTIEQAEAAIEQVLGCMQAKQPFPTPAHSLKDRVNSGIVNRLFYPAFVHASKFYAEETCISCGQCVQNCPLGNIRMENGKPTWGKQCTHCMACICRCPVQAIEYGAHSKGMARYTCPK